MTESQAIRSLSEGIFVRENESRHYQGQLENRIREEQAVNQQIQGHVAWLESILKDSEQAKLQHKTMLDNMGETQKVLYQNLALERQKVKELESRTANQKLVNETLLHSMAPEGGDWSKSLKIRHVILENQWQRDMICSLRAALQMREETVRDLQMALNGAVGSYSPGYCTTCDINDCRSASLGTPTPTVQTGDEEVCVPDERVKV